MIDERKVRAGLALAAVQPCALCGGEPDRAAVFIPNRGSRWCFYALCPCCAARPDCTSAVERALLLGGTA